MWTLTSILSTMREFYLTFASALLIITEKIIADIFDNIAMVRAQKIK